MQLSINYIVHPIVTISDLSDAIPEKGFTAHRLKQKHYAFDQNTTHVQFDMWEKVYEKCAKTLIGHVLNGYNATIFAYGATKTYTMLDTTKIQG